MKLLVSLLVALLCYGTVQEAGAALAPITFTNNFGYWTGASSAGYGTVEVTVGEDGYVHVTVSANSDYFSAADGTGIVWDKFFFNVAQGVTLDPDTIVVDEAVGSWRTAGGNISLFGDFDYGIVGTGMGNSSLDTLHFHITDPGLTLGDIIMENEDGWTFAAHLRGFDPKSTVYGTNATSTYLAAEMDPADIPLPTPLPPAIWLLGSGLGCIMLLRRRLTCRPAGIEAAGTL
jgi:hypothetical protein